MMASVAGLTQCLVTLVLASTCLTAVIITAGTEPPGREEVHNMIPDTEHTSWCRMHKITHIVTHGNCDSHTVENNVCVGKCFSYSLPKMKPDSPGNQPLYFCESCQISESHWMNLTMECKANDVSYQVKKSVQQITNCSCTACPKQQGAHVNPSEDDKEKITGLLLIDEPREDVNRDNLGLLSLPNTVLSSGEQVNHLISTANFEHSEIGSSETPGKDLRGPPYQEIVGPAILVEEDNEVIFNPEGERDLNLIPSPEVDSSSVPDLQSLMNNLNVILKGEGNVDYKRLSISELRKHIASNNELKNAEDVPEVEVHEENNDGLELPIDNVEEPPKN